jgi:hypothetical protein
MREARLRELDLAYEHYITILDRLKAGIKVRVSFHKCKS